MIKKQKKISRSLAYSVDLSSICPYRQEYLDGYARTPRSYVGLGVKTLVRWATGERLTNRLPKLCLITLSPPLNSGKRGLRMGPYVPTPKFFTISGDPGRVIYQILDMRKFTFL